MKVSEMIKNLQKFMKDNGDLDCWYAVDDEGNGYQKVYSGVQKKTKDVTLGKSKNASNSQINIII